MKLGHLIIRKIFKFVASRCQILRINAPNSISAGARPHTPLGDLRPSDGFKGPTSKRGEGNWYGMGGEGIRRREKKEGEGRKGRIPRRFGLHLIFEILKNTLPTVNTCTSVKRVVVV